MVKSLVDYFDSGCDPLLTNLSICKFLVTGYISVMFKLVNML